MTTSCIGLPKVRLEPLRPDDRARFVRDNQDAFNYGALVEFGRRDDHFEEEGEIISRETVEKAIDGGEALRITLDGANVGGAVVRIDGERGELELLFVDPKSHGKGIGQAAWLAIEKRYPQVRLWTTHTPYFEKRNIHFYVNRLGFHIVEFYNERWPDPNDPKPDEPEDGMFRFEKRIEAPTSNRLIENSASRA